MSNKAKAWMCHIASKILGIGAPLLVIALSPDMYFISPESSVSTVALIAIIIAAAEAKGTVERLAKLPKAFTVWLVILVIALLAQAFFKQLVILSATSLAAQAGRIPIDALDAKFTKRSEAEEELKLKKELDK